MLSIGSGCDNEVLYPKKEVEVSLIRLVALSACGGVVDFSFAVEGAYTLSLILATCSRCDAVRDACLDGQSSSSASDHAHTRVLQRSVHVLLGKTKALHRGTLLPGYFGIREGA